jgi:hypothetical protein
MCVVPRLAVATGSGGRFGLGSDRPVVVTYGNGFALPAGSTTCVGVSTSGQLLATDPVDTRV